MNTRPLILLLAGFLPCAQAESREPIASTTVSCQNSRWPTSGKVARYLRAPMVSVGETDDWAQGRIARNSPNSNADQAEEAERMTLYIRKEGRRVCWLGASYVQVDFFAGPDRRAAMLVHPRKTP